MAEIQTNFTIRFRSATPADRSDVTALWEVCGLTRPWNDANADFGMALDGPASAILVGEMSKKIVASVMVGHDGHRGAVYYVSISPDIQKAGLGRALMGEAEAWLKARNVPKMNLIVRSDNKQAIGFYEAIGYSVEPNVQLGKRLEE